MLDIRIVGVAALLLLALLIWLLRHPHVRTRIRERFEQAWPLITHGLGLFFRVGGEFLILSLCAVVVVPLLCLCIALFLPICLFTAVLRNLVDRLWTGVFWSVGVVIRVLRWMNHRTDALNWLLYYSDDLFARVLYALRDLLLCWAILLLPFSTFGDGSDVVGWITKLIVGDAQVTGSLSVYALVVQVVVTGLALEELLRPRDIVGFSRYAVISYREWANGEWGNRSSPRLRLRYFIKLPPQQKLYSVRVDVMAQTASQKMCQDRESLWAFHLMYPLDDPRIDKDSRIDEYFGLRGVHYVNIDLSGGSPPAADGGKLRECLANRTVSGITIRVSGQTRFGQSVIAEKTYELDSLLDGYNFKSIHGYDQAADNRSVDDGYHYSYLNAVFEEEGVDATDLVLGGNGGKPEPKDSLDRGKRLEWYERAMRWPWSGHPRWTMAERALLFLVLLAPVLRQANVAWGGKAVALVATPILLLALYVEACAMFPDLPRFVRVIDRGRDESISRRRTERR